MSTRSFPNRKISETLIDFAQPLIVLIDIHTTEAQARHAFTLAITIWNSYVLDEARGGSKYKTMLRKQLGDAWSTMPILQELIERRQRHFATDMRAIGDFRVSILDGEVRLWAEARDPYLSEEDPSET